MHVGGELGLHGAGVGWWGSLMYMYVPWWVFEEMDGDTCRVRSGPEI